MTKRILAIDDEDDIREVAQVCLETMVGWEVITASSGREGLTLAATVFPDAILLDVMMPDMDRPTTFQKLQAQAAEQKRFAELGAKAVLIKPFDPVTLAQQIATALDWQIG
jgi:CheY-like chemotaxis protein